MMMTLRARGRYASEIIRAVIEQKGLVRAVVRVEGVHRANEYLRTS